MTFFNGTLSHNVVYRKIEDQCKFIKSWEVPRHLILSLFSCSARSAASLSSTSRCCWSRSMALRRSSSAWPLSKFSFRLSSNVTKINTIFCLNFDLNFIIKSAHLLHWLNNHRLDWTHQNLSFNVFIYLLNSHVITSVQKLFLASSILKHLLIFLDLTSHVLASLLKLRCLHRSNLLLDIIIGQRPTRAHGWEPMYFQYHSEIYPTMLDCHKSSINNHKILGIIHFCHTPKNTLH